MSSQDIVNQARRKAMQDSAARSNPHTPYTRHGRHSFFADQALLDRDPAARQRLETHQRAQRDNDRAPERRALTTSVLGGLVPGASGLPLWTQNALVAAVRAAAPLYAALERVPLPPVGVHVNFAHFTSGTTTAAQNPENTTVSTNDPAIAFVEAPFSTVAGSVDISFQAVDRSGGELDAAIAQDLGAAWAAKVESELFVGTGASGRILGLSQASPTTTKTAAAQTVADYLLKLHDCWQAVTVALGRPPNLMVTHPRRLAWLRASNVGASFMTLLPPNLTIVESPAAPATLGGGTEDWTWLLNTTVLPCATDVPAVEFSRDSLATQMTLHAIIHGYVAWASNLRNEGLGVVKAYTTSTF